MSSRRCSKCKRVKPLERYSRLERGVLGRRAQCKACDKLYRTKSSKPAMPIEGDPYCIDEVTINDHFYLHFGFTDRRYNLTERQQLCKYNIQSVSTKITEHNSKQ